MESVQIAHLQPGQRIEAKQFLPGLIMQVSRVQNTTSRVIESRWKDGKAVTQDRTEYSVTIFIDSPYGEICQFRVRDGKSFYKGPASSSERGTIEIEFDGMVVSHP